MNLIFGEIKKLFLKIKLDKKNIKLDIKDNNQPNINDKKIIKIQNINWDLINILKNRDIVFVRMKDEEIKKNHIEKSHQKRPFLILKKDDDKKIATGYYFTSNMNNIFFRQHQYKGLKLVINKNNYKLSKNTMLLFNNEIQLPYENIIRKLSYLDNNDLNKLKKYKKLIQQEPILSEKENIVIEIGDIIIANNGIKYIIYQMDNTNCYGYPIYKTDVKHIDVNIDLEFIPFYKTIYFIDYENQKTFNINDTLCIIDRFNDEFIEKINLNKKELKYLNKSKKKTKK